MTNGPGVVGEPARYPGPSQPPVNTTKEPDMAENLEEYTVTINGIEHTMLLSEEDAEKYGDQAKKSAKQPQTKKTAAPANKSAS